MAERRKLTDILHGESRAKLASAWETTTAAEDGYAPLPSGIYRCRIDSGELFESRSGTPGYKITFKVADGEHAGRLLWSDHWLTGAALPLAKRELARLGVEHLEQLEQPLPEGIVADVKVRLRKSDDGREYNEVRSFDVVAFDPPEADPFAPSTETETGPTGNGAARAVHEEI